LRILAERLQPLITLFRPLIKVGLLAIQWPKG